MNNIYPPNSLSDPSLSVPFEGRGLNPNERKVNINAYDGSIIAEYMISKNRFTLPINSGSLSSYTPGTLCYSSLNQQLQISDGANWNNIIASPANTMLTLRPGYTGPSTEGVYGTWQNLYNDLIKISGEKYIMFDNSLISNVTPIQIPAGVWDMSNTTWYAPVCSLMPPPSLFIQLHILDGATINGLCGIDGLLAVTYFGTAQPAITVSITPTSKRVAISLTNGAHLNVAGGQPFIEVTSGFYEVIVQFGCHLQTGPGIIRSLSGAYVIIGLSTFATMNNDVLTGDGDFSILRFAPGSIVTIPLVQPGVTGSLSITNFYNNPDTYSFAATPGITDDNNLGYKLGDIWIDTTADNIYMAANVNTGAAVWRGPV